MNQYKKMIALVLITTQVLTTSYGQSLKGKHLVGGNGFLKYTRSGESLKSSTNAPSTKDVLQTVGLTINGIYAYSPIDNIFLGTSIGLNRTAYRTMQPTKAPYATIQAKTDISGFIRLVMPLKARFRPYLDLGAGYNLDNYRYDTETDKYNYFSVFVKPSISIFNKDYTRSFDFSNSISRIFIKDLYEEPYILGFNFGYSVYF